MTPAAARQTLDLLICLDSFELAATSGPGCRFAPSGLLAGDLLAIMTAGAYGAVEAGTYNTRALVPEVLVRASEWALVRPRVTAAALIALDRLPPWL